VLNLPVGFPSFPSGIDRSALPNLTTGAGTSVSPTDPRYQFWSPSTAIWNLQQQLNLAKPVTIYGSRSSAATPAAMPMAGASAPFGQAPPIGGLDTSGFRPPAVQDVQAVEPNAAEGDPPLPAPILPATPEALAEALPFGPPKSGLDIPFEDFETFEEFNEWLRQKIAAPEGGMFGPGMPAANMGQQPGTATTQSNATQRPVRSEYRPPIGYIGVGSNSPVQLGNVGLGPNVAAESDRLVNELNDFLRSSRSARRSPPWDAGTGSTVPPPPTSNLGRRIPSTRVPSATPAFAPQVQPRQYWQNLGGYEPPTLRIEDWRP
jgi:hypothetical protein